MTNESFNVAAKACRFAVEVLVGSSEGRQVPVSADAAERAVDSVGLREELKSASPESSEANTTHCDETVTRTSYSGGASDRSSERLLATAGQRRAKDDSGPTHNRSPNPAKPLLPPTHTMLLQSIPRSSSGSAAIE